MARVLSGVKPTGRPHIGNYLGAMKQFVEMQDQNECFIFVANYHALTTLHDSKLMEKQTIGVVLDYLAIGLDPKKVNLFLQSDVPEVTELAWILGCVTPMGLLERAHAYKDAKDKNRQINWGVFSYPVLMAADILIYQSDLVPVGRDQKQHVEMARDIAEYFNSAFGKTFKIPKEQIKKEVETITGLDGRKMSKSYDNYIGIFDEPDVIRQKVSGMVTDVKRIKRDDPGHPDECNAFQLIKLFEEISAKQIADECRKATLGCVDCKKQLAENIVSYLEPMRQKRAELENKTGYVMDVLQDGAKKAQDIARKTLADARQKVGFFVAEK